MAEAYCSRRTTPKNPHKNACPILLGVLGHPPWRVLVAPGPSVIFSGGRFASNYVDGVYIVSIEDVGQPADGGAANYYQGGE